MPAAHPPPPSSLEGSAPGARIAPLARREHAAAAGLLARAFRDQPLPRAVFGASAGRRLRGLRLAMQLHLGAVDGVAWCTASRAGEALVGVLVAAPPGAWPLPAPPLARRLRVAWRLGLATARRQAALSEVLEARQPPGSHWTLGVVGVEPARARRGLGSGLVRDWLRQVDLEGAPAYLETDLPANLRFYHRFGFRQAQRFEALGVRVWGLERPPQGDAGLRAGRPGRPGLPRAQPG